MNCPYCNEEINISDKNVFEGVLETDGLECSACKESINLVPMRPIETLVVVQFRDDTLCTIDEVNGLNQAKETARNYINDETMDDIGAIFALFVVDGRPDMEVLWSN